MIELSLSFILGFIGVQWCIEYKKFRRKYQIITYTCTLDEKNPSATIYSYKFKKE